MDDIPLFLTLPSLTFLLPHGHLHRRQTPLLRGPHFPEFMSKKDYHVNIRWQHPLLCGPICYIIIMSKIKNLCELGACRYVFAVVTYKENDSVDASNLGGGLVGSELVDWTAGGDLVDD